MSTFHLYYHETHDTTKTQSSSILQLLNAGLKLHRPVYIRSEFLLAVWMLLGKLP